MGLLSRSHSRGRLGQSTAEYALLFGVAITAIVAMQVYVKRGMNARFKDATDSATDAVWAKLGNGGAPPKEATQYEPYYTSSSYAVDQKADRVDHMETGGIVKKTGIDESTKRTGSQTTGIAQ